MIKHAIQHQPHALRLGFTPQAQQRPIAAKLRIDMAIIFRVVLMDARRGKYRIQI